MLVETGDKRDGRGYRIATLARRAELVAEYRQSGLTMAAFARREGLAYSTFAGWVWKSDRARGNGRGASPNGTVRDWRGCQIGLARVIGVRPIFRLSYFILLTSNILFVKNSVRAANNRRNHRTLCGD